MSVLVIGLGEEVLPVLIRRLVDEDDEVRVLERGDADSGRWRGLGAHIATGPLWDADLVERAAQNVRTIVIGGEHDQDPGEFMEELLRGGGFASPDMRIVVVGRPGDSELEQLRASSLQYVVLDVPRRRWGGGKNLEPERLAEAIDAADDLAGAVRLELDLGTPDAWRKLRLDPG